MPPWFGGIVKQPPVILPGPGLIRPLVVLLLATGCYYAAEELVERWTDPRVDTGPQPEPKPTIACCVLPQSTPPRPREEYVADSNIFMDRVEQGYAQRNRINNNYLANPDVILYVPAAAISEIKPTPSQMFRLSGVIGGAEIVPVPDGDLSGYNIGALISGQVNENDLKIMKTARDISLPLLTTNEGMIKQIDSDPNFGKHPDHGNLSRHQIFGSVRFVVP